MRAFDGKFIVAAIGCGVVSAALLLAAPALDEVIIANPGPSSEVGLIIRGQNADGRVDRCELSTSLVLKVGDLSLSPDANEVVGFAERRPVKYLETPWTPSSDRFNLSFGAEIMVPIVVWIVQGPYVEQKTQAEYAVARTVGIWKDERMGVNFSKAEIRNATDAAGASDVLDFNQKSPDDPAWKRLRDVRHIDGVVNIYWVSRVDGISNMGASNKRDLVAMGSLSSGSLLAHEIGHAFSLEHVDALPGFDETNLMSHGSGSREYLTEGQIFRAHLDTKSALNVLYAARPGEKTRPCAAGDPLCPRLDLRIWADGIDFPRNCK